MAERGHAYVRPVAARAHDRERDGRGTRTHTRTLTPTYTLAHSLTRTHTVHRRRERARAYTVQYSIGIVREAGARGEGAATTGSHAALSPVGCIGVAIGGQAGTRPHTRGIGAP